MSTTDHVLLVDDNVDSREALAFFLRDEGYRVTEAGSAEEGLSHLAREPFALVISDYMMPGQDGVWMIREAERTGALRGTPTLVVTAHPDPIAGDLRVIQKPFDIDDLLAQVAELTGFVARGDEAEQAEQAGPEDVVELVLYVTSSSMASRRAVRNAQRAVERHRAGSVRLVVREVATHLDHAIQDRVDFTPTLIRTAPGPKVRVLGDLRNAAVLDEILTDAGLEPG